MSRCRRSSLSQGRRRLAAGVATALVATSLPSAAHAKGPAAVVPLLAVNLDDDGMDEVTGALARALQDAGAGPVLGGRAVRRRMPPESLAPDCPASPSCVEQVRARLEVDDLVFVITAKIGESLQVDPVVVTGTTSSARPALLGHRAQMTDPAWLIGSVQGWLPRALVEVEDPGWARPGWATWTAAGVSVAALAVGVGLGISANAKEADLVDAGCEVRRCADEDIDALARTAGGADAAFVVAGAAALSAVALYVFVDGPTEVAVQPAGATGVAVVGRF